MEFGRAWENGIVLRANLVCPCPRKSPRDKYRDASMNRADTTVSHLVGPCEPRKKTDKMRYEKYCSWLQQSK